MGALLFAASAALLIAADAAPGALASTPPPAVVSPVVSPVGTPLPAGTLGALSLPALVMPEPGRVALSVGGDFYRGSEFLLPDSTTQRTMVMLGASVGVLSWLEAYGAIGGRAASSSSSASTRSLSSLGDFDLGVKLVFPPAGPLSAGALVQLDVPAGIDSMTFKGTGGRAFVLAGLALGIGPVPLSGTLLVGYHLDNTGRLVENPAAPTSVPSVGTLPAFGLDISFYDHLIGGFTLQSPLRYASPVAEVVLEAPVARDVALPPGGHPIKARLLLGANAIGLGLPGLQATAGLQLSLVQTGQLDASSLPMAGWPPDPPWAVRVSVSWAFEPKLPQRAKDLHWREQPKALTDEQEEGASGAGPKRARAAKGGATVSAASAAKVQGDAEKADRELAGATLATPIVSGPLIPPDQGRLSLLLVDGRTQQPVGGAWVSLLESSDREATTGADGRARLDVAPGSLTLAVAKEGFEPTTQPVTAVAGQDRHITLQLQPVQADCTLRGKLVAEDGEPLRASLVVALVGASAPPAEAQVFEGAFRLSLPHGEWSLVAEAPGYRAEPVKIELLPGETRAKDLVLKRMAGEPIARLSPGGVDLSRRVAFLPSRGQLMPQSAGPLEDLARTLSGLTAPLVVGVRVEPLDLGASADDAVAALKLGEERARAIVEVLVGKGVPRHLLLPRGLGLAKPMQPTLELRLATAQGRPRSLVEREGGE